MQFHRGNGVAQILDDFTFGFGPNLTISCHEALNHGYQEIALPHRWLEQSSLIQRLVGCIPRQIEDEIHHLSASEHRTAGLDT